MSKQNEQALNNAILVSIASAFAQGQYGSAEGLKAAGTALGVDGNTLGVALEGLMEQGLVLEGPSETEFGLSQEALDFANSLIEQSQAAPAPAPAAATPTPKAASKAPAKAPTKGASKTPAKKAQASPAPQAQNEDEDGGEDGFRMRYTQADKLTVQELAQRVEIGLAAAEANHAMGQTIVAELIMRSLSRLQRRLNKAQKQGTGVVAIR